MSEIRLRNAKTEQRLRQRTAQILDAAARVFARKGFHRATTKEIAQEAGVAEGTIYNYYQTKRDLLIAMIARLASESIVEVLERADTMDVRTFLAEIIKDRFAVFDRNGAIWQVIIYELIVDEDLRRRYLSEVIAPLAISMIGQMNRRLQSGEVRHVNLRVVLPAIVGSVFMAGIATSEGNPLSILEGPPQNREEVIAELVEFVLRGIGASAGS